MSSDETLLWRQTPRVEQQQQQRPWQQREGSCSNFNEMVLRRDSGSRDDVYYDFELFHGQQTWGSCTSSSAASAGAGASLAAAARTSTITSRRGAGAAVARRRIERELTSLTRTRCLLQNHELVDAMLGVLAGFAEGGSNLEVAEQLVETLSCLMMVDSTAKFDVIRKGYLSTVFNVKYSPFFHRRQAAFADVPGGGFERVLEEALRIML